MYARRWRERGDIHTHTLYTLYTNTQTYKHTDMQSADVFRASTCHGPACHLRPCWDITPNISEDDGGMLEPWSSCIWRVTTGYHRKGSTREPNSTIATTNRIWFFDTDGRYWYILTSLSQWFWVVSLKNSQQNYQNWAAGEATQPPPTPPYDGPSHRPGTAASVHSPVPAICIWSAGPAQRDFPICSLALSNELAASDIIIYIYILYTYYIILFYIYILYYIMIPTLFYNEIWGGESYWNFILKFHFCNHAFSMINIPHHSMSLASRWKLNTCA